MTGSIDKGLRLRLRRVWAPLLAGVALGLFLAGGLASVPANAAAGKPCVNAKATLATDGTRKVRNGTECLIAKARAKAARHSLKRNSAVRGVSKRHAKTMVQTNCFRHVCSGEGSIPTRLKRAGYLDGAATYGFGENTGCATTPKAMVQAWLASRYHRKNLLGRKFRDIGTGVVRGAPDSQSACQGRGFMTFSVLFTWRKG